MQKALLLALIFGAFLFLQPAQADEFLDYSCPDGGTYQEHPELGHICSVPAPSGRPSYAYGRAGSYFEGRWPAPAHQALETYNYEIISGNCTTTYTADGTPPPEPVNFDFTNNYSDSPNIPDFYGCTSNDFITRTISAGWAGDPIAYCPPDNNPVLRNFGGTEPELFCWAPAVLLNDCPEQNGDCEEEPPCETDDFGNCIVPPEECFLTGSGSEVCYADPNEKCDVNYVNDEPVYSNCESGCGFVGENLDNFICADKPELPSLDDCIITTNGYACPSDIPEPNDDITDPDKPNSDMKKSDFKDVLIGVETRQDATNKLLSEQIKRDQDNTNKLAGKLDIGNKALKGIEDNTGSAAKSLREGLYGDALEIDDGTSSLLSDLGLTGDESITDLEKGVVSLSDYRDQFTWSAGSSTCPAPRSMNILNKTFSIEWDPYCDAFSVLGYFIKAAALFLSGFIAFGVRK